MEIIGLDLHKRESQLSIRADDGTSTDRRIVTNRERYVNRLELPRPRRFEAFGYLSTRYSRRTTAMRSDLTPSRSQCHNRTYTQR